MYMQFTISCFIIELRRVAAYVAFCDRAGLNSGNY
jgi:hypothetical protein